MIFGKTDKKRPKNSIKKVYVILFTMLILVIVMIMAVSSILTVNRITVKNAYESIQEMEKQAINTLDENVRTLDHLLDIAVSDSSITELLARTVRNREYMKPRVVEKLFYLTNLSISELKDIYIIGTNGLILMSTPRTTYDGRDLVRQKWYEQVLESDGIVLFDNHMGSYVDMDETAEIISFGKCLKDPATGETIGVALVDVYFSMIRNLFYEINAKSVQSYFFDAEGNQILDTGSGKIDAALEESFQNNVEKNSIVQYKATINGKRAFIGSRMFAEEYTYVSCLVTEELSQGTNQLIIITIVLAIVLFVLGVMCATVFAGFITKPIARLCDNMNRVENGDLSVVMPVNREDEIGMMSMGFNVMVKKISELIEQNKCEQNRLRRAQIKIYHEQIKPHFLYNTLDSIICMVHLGENEKAESMLYALVKFFRFGLADEELIVSVADEIGYTENYLLIQKIRYNEVLQYEFLVPRDLYGICIPKMILQPLVENAIYHGLKQKRGIGMICVSMRGEANMLHIEITDTGIGMSEERLYDINAALREPDAAERRKLGIGILNVSDRIRAIYGNDSEMYYESRWGVGTTVHIRLPIREELIEND